jgi:ATP-dependent Lhr-like helicase
MIERLREKLSNESVADRIARMLAPLEKAAGGGATSDAEAVRGSLAFGRESGPDKAPKPAPRERRARRPRGHQ